MPRVPVGVREAARAKLRDIGTPAVHAELARRDPVMAEQLFPGDGQRMLRAWEVLESSGRLAVASGRRTRASPCSTG